MSEDDGDETANFSPVELPEVALLLLLPFDKRATWQASKRRMYAWHFFNAIIATATNRCAAYLVLRKKEKTKPKKKKVRSGYQ